MTILPLLLVVLLLGQLTQTFYFSKKEQTSQKLQSIPKKIVTIEPEKPQNLATVAGVITQASPSATPKSSKKPKSSKSPQQVNSSLQLVDAVNSYREQKGLPRLIIDSKLTSYSQERANYYATIGKIDKHQAFNDFIKNQDGFKTLGFMSLAENSGFGHKLSAKDLIETIFAKSPGHNKNLLNKIYTHIGIGINGTATNFVFGGKKI